MNTTSTAGARGEIGLLDFRINDTSPFPSDGECLDSCLSQASALLTVLSCLTDEETLGPLNPAIQRAALEGVQTLVNLAQHHVDNSRLARR